MSKVYLPRIVHGLQGRAAAESRIIDGVDRPKWKNNISCNVMLRYQVAICTTTSPHPPKVMVVKEVLSAKARYPIEPTDLNYKNISEVRDDY